MRNIFIVFFLLFGFFSLKAEDIPKVDIIFIVDTSGSMDDEARALFDSIDRVVSNLSSILDIDTKLWGITETKWELDSNVNENIKNPTSNNIEDWGPAVYDVVSKYDGWRDGAIKIVIPISDECPEDGDDCDSEDEKIIKLARDEADRNGVHVLPIIGGSPQHIDLYSKIKQLASSLSTEDGKIIVTSSEIFADEMEDVIEDIIASVTGKIVRKPVLAEPVYIGKYIKVPIIKASGAMYIEWQVIENGALVETRRSKNIQRAYISVLDKASHNFLLKVRSVGIDKDGREIYSGYSSINIEYIGTISNLISKCKREPNMLQCKTQRELILEDRALDNGLLYNSIDITNGNFRYSHVDMELSSVGFPLKVVRYYNSIDLKRGWSFNIISRMDTDNINYIRVYWGDGRVETFIKSETGWSSKYGTSLIYTKSNYYIVKRRDGVKFKFSFDGKLAEVINKNGLGYIYEYESDRILIKDSFNNPLLTLYLDSNGNILSIRDIDNNEVTYSYNESGDIVSYTNRENHTTTYQYRNGFLSSITIPSGNILFKNIYDSNGRVVKYSSRGFTTKISYVNLDRYTYLIPITLIKYPDKSTKRYINFYNRVVSTIFNRLNINYSYDIFNKISKIIDSRGYEWIFLRDEAGHLVKRIEPLNRVYRYSYNGDGNLILIKDPLGRETKFFYKNSNLVKIKYPDGSNKRFVYNENNQLIEIKNQLGDSILYSYNSRGLISKVTLSNGAEFKYRYTSLGKVSTIENPFGDIKKYTYNREGNLTSIRDEAGNITLFKYDIDGNLIEKIEANGAKTIFKYRDGLKNEVIYPDGSSFKYKYDYLSRLIQIEDATGARFKMSYNYFGKLSKVIYPSGKFIEYRYSKDGKFVDIIRGDGSRFRREYDPFGELVKEFDTFNNLMYRMKYNQLGLLTLIDNDVESLSLEYDSLKNISKSTLSGLSILFKYNSLGNVIRVVDSRDFVYEFEYDSLGNLIEFMDPLGEEILYSYDICGRLESFEIGDRRVSFEYNRVGEIEKIIYSDNSSIEYHYNSLGKVVLIKDKKREISYGYDLMGRVISRVDTYGHRVTYLYNSLGKIASVIYPDGKKIEYKYNRDGNLSKVIDFNGNITRYIYDKGMKLSKIIYPNGFSTIYKYDKNRRLIGVLNLDRKGRAFCADILTRDNIGRVKNIASVSPLEPTLKSIRNYSLSYNEVNRVDEFEYDSRGNLLGYLNNHFKYNIRDRLIYAKVETGKFEFKYDAENRVIGFSKDGIYIEFITDKLLGNREKVLADVKNGVINRYYIYDNYGNLLYSLSKDSSMQIYFYNYRGDCTALIGENGDILNGYIYSIYGEVLDSFERVENRYKFRAKYGAMSYGKNLVYIDGNYYSSYLKRWLSPVSKDIRYVLNPLDLNRYRFRVLKDSILDVVKSRSNRLFKKYDLNDTKTCYNFSKI
jgi:YD repeat-containing protein